MTVRSKPVLLSAAAVRRVVRAIFMVGALALVACHAVAPSPPMPPQSSGSSGASNDVYRVHKNDLLAVSFLDEPQLNQQVKVDWQGKIELSWFVESKPAIVQVEGKTPSEIASAINEVALRSRILNAPRSAVLVAEYAEQTFVIQGQVPQPGRYLFPKGYTPKLPLPEAVAMAGGYTRLASVQRVLVRRGTEIHKLNLDRMLSRPGEMFMIQPGDMITVPERIF